MALFFLPTFILKKGFIFFAIKGTQTDGHKFLADAIRKGAIKSVVSKNVKQSFKNKVIKVKNVFSSLNELAKSTRENTSAQRMNNSVPIHVRKYRSKVFNAFNAYKYNSS